MLDPSPNSDAPHAPLSPRLVWLIFAVTALAVLSVAFGPWLGGEFVWDDVYLVQNNTALLAPSGAWEIVRQDLWGQAKGDPSQLYHPVPMLTVWAQAQLTGMSLAAFRLVNVLTHGLVGAALLALLLRLGLSGPVAAAAALLVLVHPSATEPVMWITGRHDTIAALFSLLALLCWPRLTSPEEEPPLPRAHAQAAVAGLCCLLAFWSKEPYIVTPALLVALHGVTLITRRRGDLKPAALRAASFALWPAAALAVGIAVRTALDIPLGNNQMSQPITTHVVNFASISAHLLGQLLTFSNGATITPYAPLPGWAVALVWAGWFAAVGGGALLAWRLAEDRRALLVPVGVIWVGFALAPHLVSVPSIGFYGNRYAYFALLGLAVALAPLAEIALERARPELRRVSLGVAVVLVVGLAGLTSSWASLWQSDLSLYSYDVTRDPNNGFAQYHLGHAIRRHHGCERALPHFVRATQLTPRYDRAWHNSAGCLINLKRFKEALPAAREAARLRPTDAGSAFNLGLSLAMTGQLPEAEQALTRAVRLDPGHGRAAGLLKAVRGELGRSGAP